jgi:Domain of unknown function (DUF4169)
MAEIINLRRTKKNIAREETEKNAEANRIKFGRTKAEKTLTSFKNARDAKSHQGNKLDK